MLDFSFYIVFYLPLLMALLLLCEIVLCRVISNFRQRCDLCPGKDGALKRTDSGGCFVISFMQSVFVILCLCFSLLVYFFSLNSWFVSIHVCFFSLLVGDI